MQTKPCLLVIGKVWPEPASSAAGWRMLQLLSAFKQLHYKIHFASAAGKSPYSADLKSMDIQEDAILLNDPSFDVYVKQIQPDVVLFDRFTSEEQFGWRITEQVPHALQILDTEDLHGLRAARQLALKEKRELKPEDLHSTLMLRELASIYRCDLNLIISSFEFNLLKVLFKVPENILHYVPLLRSPEIEEGPAFEHRQHFLSIGNFLHAPNLDAVEFLHQEIWPLIRKALPKAELHIYGAYTPDRIKQWHQPAKGFLVKDRAENAAEVMKAARVCLAPLRFGAGQKGKLLLAMECGTPSVTTPVGAEGMDQGLQWPGAVHTTANAFAEAAVRLYTQKDEWQNAHSHITHLLSHYEGEVHLQNFKSRLREILSQLQSHRATNFTGALLRQSAHQSTRYMSLWITAKNLAVSHNPLPPKDSPHTLPK